MGGDNVYHVENIDDERSGVSDMFAAADIDNIHLDSLLDGMTILFDECLKPEMQKEASIQHFIKQFAPTMAKLKSMRPSVVVLTEK
eukprot:Pgem_evm1s9798